MRKLNKVELSKLWERQNDLAMELVDHTIATLVESFANEQVELLFAIHDNVAAKNLFSDDKEELVNTAVEMLLLAAKLDGIAYRESDLVELVEATGDDVSVPERDKDFAKCLDEYLD